VEAQGGEEADDAVRHAGAGGGEHLVLAQRGVGEDVEAAAAPLQPPLGHEPGEGNTRQVVLHQIARAEDAAPTGERQNLLPRRLLYTVGGPECRHNEISADITEHASRLAIALPINHPP